MPNDRGRPLPHLRSPFDRRAPAVRTSSLTGRRAAVITLGKQLTAWEEWAVLSEDRVGVRRLWPAAATGGREGNR